jgi:preprotein translocase subunit YajC
VKNLILLQLTLLPAFIFANEGDMPPRDNGIWQTVIMIGIAMFFFYFILWRPEQKRRKIIDEQRSAMKKGDKVTAMGIIGTVSKINDQTVILNMIEGAKIEVLKGAITEVISSAEETK